MAHTLTQDDGPLLYWRIMQALDADYGYFTAATLIAISGVKSRRGVDHYLAFLVEEKILRRTPAKSGGPARHRYTIERKGSAPPGSRAANATVARQQQALWTAMRCIRSFTRQELALAASVDTLTVSLSVASTYLQALAGVGYVAKTGGENRTTAFYRLIPGCNTGPRAPIVLPGRGLYDVNLMREVAAILHGRPA
jgi:hypothetical protein